MSQRRITLRIGEHVAVQTANDTDDRPFDFRAVRWVGAQEFCRVIVDLHGFGEIGIAVGGVHEDPAEGVEATGTAIGPAADTNTLPEIGRRQPVLYDQPGSMQAVAERVNIRPLGHEVDLRRNGQAFVGRRLGSSRNACHYGGTAW